MMNIMFVNNQFDEYNVCIDQQIVFIRNETDKNQKDTFNFNRLNRNNNKRFIIEQTEYDKNNIEKMVLHLWMK